MIRLALKKLADIAGSLGTIVFVALIGAIFLHAIFDDVITIQPISVPKDLAERGFTPEVMASRLRDGANEIIIEVNSNYSHRDFMELSDLLDLTVPKAGISIHTLAVQVRSLLGLRPRASISGEVSFEDGHLTVLLRNNGHLFFTSTKGADPQKPKDLFQDAAQALLEETQPYFLGAWLESRDSAASLRICSRIISDPNKDNEEVAQAYNLEGIILDELNRRDEAVADLKKAIEYDPNVALLHYNLGDVVEENGWHSEAIEEYRKAIKLDNRDADSHYNLGYVLEKVGKYENAAAEYTKAIEIHPDEDDYHYNLGNSFEELGRHADAITQYEIVAKINPKYAHAHYNLGGVFVELHRYQDAIAEYNKAIDGDPKDASSYINLGNVMKRLGRIDDAVASYKKAKELSSN